MYSRSDSVVLVKHTGHPIEAEAIELVLLHPETEVAQEKAEHFMMAIVKEPTVPQVMIALSATMEVMMITAIEHIQAIQRILRGMRMHDIKQDRDAHRMSRINQFLKIIRVTISTASGKKAVDLIAKTGIVCMFHDGHELDGVVAQFMDAG